MPLFATVQPGVTVTNTTALTSSILNRLGTPTVDIVGEVDGTGSITIASGAVTDAMLVNMIGPTLKGRRSSTPGPPTDVAIDDLTIEMANIGATGTLRVAAGGILTAHIATASSAATGVTYAKMQQVAAVSLVGNPTASLAAPIGITLGAGLAFSGTTLRYSAASGILGCKAERSIHVQNFDPGDANGRAIDGTAFTFAQGRAVTTNGSADLSLSYTPISATSYLIVEATVPVQLSGDGSTLCLALFQDASGTDEAVNVGVTANSTNSIVLASVRSYLPSTNTSARTFKLRLATAGNPGVTSANTATRMIVNGYWNGSDAAAGFAAGKQHAVLSVMETEV